MVTKKSGVEEDLKSLPLPRKWRKYWARRRTASAKLLVAILKDEEGHIDSIGAKLNQIKQLGVENYLAEQIRQ